MASASDDSSFSSNYDTNQFLVWAGIELQISYTTIRDFTSWANWNSGTTYIRSYNIWVVPFMCLFLKIKKKKKKITQFGRCTIFLYGNTFFIPTSYFCFSLYFFILPLLVHKWKLHSILVLTVTHLMEIFYVANRKHYWHSKC